MKCQVIKDRDMNGLPQEAPVCVWGDDSTVALVVPMRMSGSLSLDEGARLAADARADSRWPRTEPHM